VITAIKKQLLEKAADEYFELAQEEVDAHFRNRLIGMRRTLVLLGEDGLADYIRNLLDQLPKRPEVL
jgi:hypothetical protein